MKAETVQHAREGLVAVLPVVEKSASIREAFSIMRKHQHHAVVRRDGKKLTLITASALSGADNKSATSLSDVVGAKVVRSIPAKDIDRIQRAAKLKPGESLETKVISGLTANLASGGVSSDAVTVFAKSAGHAVWIKTHYSYCLSCGRVVKTATKCCDKPDQVQS